MKQDTLIFGRLSQHGEIQGPKSPIRKSKTVEEEEVKQIERLDVGDVDLEINEKRDCPDTQSDSTNKAERNTIYVKNQPSDEFYLILKGKILVCSGQEGFFIELSSFNFLGMEALLNDRYQPDFAAKAIEKSRLLKIKRIDYRKALFNVKNQQQ